MNRMSIRVRKPNEWEASALPDLSSSDLGDTGIEETST